MGMITPTNGFPMAEKTRLDVFRSFREGAKAMGVLNRALDGTELGSALIELIKIRASITNKCEYCVDFHRKVGSKAGISDERLDALESWEESDLFSDRERAALELTDVLTDPVDGVDGTVFDRAGEHFTDVEITQVVYVIANIAAWNRIMLADHAAV